MTITKKRLKIIEDRTRERIFFLPAGHTQKEAYDFLKLHEKAHYIAIVQEMSMNCSKPIQKFYG